MMNQHVGDTALAAQNGHGTPEILPDSNHTLVILSDLHLAEGCNPESRRWSRHEDFFYDRELASFLQHQRQNAQNDNRPLWLLLAGDVFDFLTVVSVPEKEDMQAMGLKRRWRERKVGLPHNATASVWKLERIAAGHPRVFAALAQVLVDGGRIILLPGNHDPELFFPEVRHKFLQILFEHAKQQKPDTDPKTLQDRFCYEPWFWYEPGRIFVEHGHQYDESNVVSHLLYPIDPGQLAQADPEIDLPVGSLFVRFLHNTFKQHNPYIRNFISLEQYLKFLSGQNIVLVVRRAYRNFTFAVRLLAETPLWTGEKTQSVQRKHLELRRQLEERTQTAGVLEKLEARWPLQMARTKARLTRKLLIPALRQVGLALGAVLATLYLWSLLFNIILAVPWLAEGPFAKAGWLALFSMITFVVIAITVRATSRLLRSSSDASFSSLEDHATEVSQLLDVPYVAMGHSHLADQRQLSTGARYINTGTWTAMQGPWNAIHPRALQFTFGKLDDAGLHLRRWDHAAQEEVPVQLFEEPKETFLQRLGALGADEEEEEIDPLITS